MDIINGGCHGFFNGGADKMSNGKRAFQAEQREKKIEGYKKIIIGLINQVQEYPFFDYSSELEKLHHKFPQDRAEILAAEREAYREHKRT